jgi:hypothetical protein
MTSIGGHQSPVNLSRVWLTPRDTILNALGSFDLDPCAAPEPRPWGTARRHITLPEDGLSVPWEGRVWLNPPYGAPAIIAPWMRRMADHSHGTALTFARTETAMFFETVWRRATAVLFIEGRLYFHTSDGIRAKSNADAPSCLVAYGERDAEILEAANIPGHFVTL